MRLRMRLAASSHGQDWDDFEGTLVVEVSDGRVAAIALELGTQPGQFTTLPVTPLN